MENTSRDALETFRSAFNTFAAERLRLLLETKHLYQKLSIVPSELRANIKNGITGITLERDDFDRRANEFIHGRFILSERLVFEVGRSVLCLAVGNVKLFCAKCDTREAFRPIWFSDITSDLIRENTPKKKFKLPIDNSFQLFYLVYQCQHCEGIPEVFLVKRDGLDLTIEGRSPFEHIEIPPYIPKDERHWFRDAVIGFQTGKILAALFYLRTFIEQFARGKTNLKDERKTGDEIMVAYGATIPENLRETMPSLGDWYGKLSAALHGAKEDIELFETARQKIEKHFEIRRVHELDRTNA